jgi:hypothetical protein
MTIETLPSAELPLRTTSSLPKLLLQGFQLGVRNWPCVVWAYAINLMFGLLAGIPLSGGLAPYLDHSLAAKNIAGTINISYLGELAIQLRETGFFPMALQTAQWLTVLQVLLLFVLFAGSMFVYVAAEPPRFSVLLRGGIAYFWRFARAAVVAGFVATLILGFLLGIRGLLLDHARTVYVERRLFVWSALSAVLVLLVGLLVRLWWDLVEVYIVRNAMDGERSIRQALMPALRLLLRHFLPISGSFLLSGLAGVLALVLCLFLWRLVPANQVWVACLLAQLGLFLLLAGRFWQRGVETTLVMSQDPPRITTDEMEPEETVEEAEQVPTTGGAAYTGLSEPTLRDLVLKLKTEPLANPEILAAALPPTISAPNPVPGPPEVVKPVETIEPAVSRLDQHETKFPLGGATPVKEAVEPKSVDKPADNPSKPSKTEKP